ncbi:hypothetical protein EB001_18990 [bacterium]|nr:hypothetical protein [bacterium]
MPVNDLITIRKGTASEWSSSNPVLASGELGFDLSNNILKIGDGSSAWNSLNNHSHSSINISDFTESVQDIVGSGFLVAGTGIVLDYNDSANTLTISSSGTGGGVSITNFSDNRILTSDGTSTGINAESNLTFDGTSLKVNNINVSVSGHFHTSSDISNFNSSVSGLLPVTNIDADGKSIYIPHFANRNYTA